MTLRDKPVCVVKPFIVLIKCIACGKFSRNNLCEQCSDLFDQETDQDILHNQNQEGTDSIEESGTENDSSFSEYYPDTDIEESSTTSASETLYSSDTLSDISEGEIIHISDSVSTDQDEDTR